MSEAKRLDDRICRKCNEIFARALTAVMNTACIDGQHHDWYSPYAELTAERDKYRKALDRITYYASEHAEHCSCDMCEIFRITRDAVAEQVKKEIDDEK